MRRSWAAAGLLVLGLMLGARARAGEAIPQGEQTFFGPNGVPLALGFVYTYVPGTTTPKTSWQDPALSVANSNPISLDANGQARIWGTAGASYRQVVLDSTGALVWDLVTKLPGSTSGPSPTVVGHLATWNSTDGSLLGGDPSIAVNVNDLDLQAGSLASISSFNSLYFPSFTNQTTALRLRLGLTGTVSDSVGSYTDAAYFEATDGDTSTSYTLQHVVDSARLAVFGPTSGGVWEASSKQLNGLTAYAYGKSSAVSQPTYSPGLSGLQAFAVQYGGGVGDNEIWARQLSSAYGTTALANQLVGLKVFIDSNYADTNSSHVIAALQLNNVGAKNINTVIGYSGASGTANYFLDSGNAAVKTAGILMPHSYTGYVGTIIDYGSYNGGSSGDYTSWDSSTYGGQYRWTDSGTDILHVDTAGTDLATSAAAIPTTAVGPFVYLSAMSGTPTGTPTKYGPGSVPCVWDTAATKMWCFDYATLVWKFAQFN